MARSEEIIVYRAACPGCGADAVWHGVIDVSRDLTTTSIAYRIECESCVLDLDAERAARRRAGLVRQTVSRSGWLGRSA